MDNNTNFFVVKMEALESKMESLELGFAENCPPMRFDSQRELEVSEVYHNKSMHKSPLGSPGKIQMALVNQIKSEKQLTLMSFSDHLELSGALQNSSQSKKTPQQAKGFFTEYQILENSHEDLTSQNSKNQTYENLTFCAYPKNGDIFQLDDDSISSLDPGPDHRPKAPRENPKIDDPKIRADVQGSSLSLTLDSVFFEENRKVVRR